MKTINSLPYAALLAFAAPVIAQNPIIHDQFTADPTARVFNEKVYLYPSHDIDSPVDELKDWFCMEDYHVFSSENFVDWTDHGVILSQNNIPWVKPDSYAMWAPDCVEKNGRFYFYFPAAPNGVERGFAIGVAVADDPAGPFTPMPSPIERVMGIDPCVLIDNDAKAYLYWSGMGLSVAPLKDNMLQIDGEPVRIQGLPEGFKEGPFAFKRNNKYYLTFPWVRKETETLAYAMSDSPIGPFEFKGVIMDESPSGCWTNHHSILEKNGQWYLFYHHNDFSPDMDKRRSARIDSLNFNPDGTIVKVVPTLRGVGISDARQHIQIDRYSSISKKNISVKFLNPDNKFEGWCVDFSNPDAWLRYNKVDFTSKPVEEMKIRAKSSNGGKIIVCDADKKVIAQISVPVSSDWQIINAPVAYSPKGITDLLLTLANGNAEVDWIGFDLQQ